MDALPAGFTRTPSKVEIKLIRLVFTPEEALVAGGLSCKLETCCRDRRNGSAFLMPRSLFYLRA